MLELSKKARVFFLFTVTSIAFLYTNCKPMHVMNFSNSDLSSTGVPIFDQPDTPAPPAISKVFSCSDPNQLSSQPMRRLTTLQYSNTLNELFGQGAVDQVGLELRLVAVDKQSRDPKKLPLAYTTTQIKNFESIAKKVAIYVSNSSSVVRSYGGSCMDQNSPDRSCMMNFLSKITLKTMRRPGSQEEIDRLYQDYSQINDKKEGIQFIVRSLMQSPYFLYRVEVGNNANNANRFALTQFEIASRISFLVWDSMPDDQLLDRAVRGELSNPQIARSEIERLLNHSKGREKLHRFLGEWLMFNKIPEITQKPDRFLAGISTNNLKEDMVNELVEFFDHMFYVEKSNFKGLLTSKKSFARTSNLAKLYGHSPAPTGQSVDMPGNRVGLALRAPMLLDNDTETHPIIRGTRFRERFFCEVMPAPQVDEDDDGFNISSESMKIKHSTRDRTHILTGSRSCASCHKPINPVGYTMESFDPLGRIRNFETQYRADGSTISTHQINDSVDKFIAPAGGGFWRVNGALDLASQTSASPHAAGCFARQVFRYYWMQDENRSDACLLEGALRNLASDDGSLYEGFISVVLNSYLYEKTK